MKLRLEIYKIYLTSGTEMRKLHELKHNVFCYQIYFFCQISQTDSDSFFNNLTIRQSLFYEITILSNNFTHLTDFVRYFRK